MTQEEADKIVLGTIAIGGDLWNCEAILHCSTEVVMKAQAEMRRRHPDMPRAEFKHED